MKDREKRGNENKKWQRRQLNTQKTRTQKIKMLNIGKAIRWTNDAKKAANEPTKTKQPARQPTIQSANDDGKVFRIGKQSVSLASTTANEKRMCVAIAFPSFQDNAANEENGSYGIIKWIHVTEKNALAWGCEEMKKEEKSF